MERGCLSRIKTCTHRSKCGQRWLAYRGLDCYHPSDLSEANRIALNQCIWTSGAFDAVIDFDKAMSDPLHPDHLGPKVDSGDHLHTTRMGTSASGWRLVPLDLFQ